MPFFSVVMPIYNKGPHIGRAIRSVLNQSFEDFELILVNDASTDNSLEEIEKVVDPRIRLFHREVPGPGGYAARNLGIREAYAEWVAFLDADDEWYPQHLEEYLKIISKFPAVGMLSCGYRIEDRSYGDVNPYFKQYHQFGDHIIPKRVFLEQFAKNSFIQFTSCSCIKRSLLEAIGGFPDGIVTKAGDIYTWIMCALNTDVIAWSAHLGAIYHQDSENMVTKTNYPSPDSLMSLTSRLLDASPEEYKKLLKRIHNRRIITEYKRAIVVPGKRFEIARFLFFSVNPIGFLLWSIIDLIVNFFPQRWISNLNLMRKMIRGLRT